MQCRGRVYHHPPPAYGDSGSPYTTEFTAHCRTYYTSFFCFCTGEGSINTSFSSCICARAGVWNDNKFRTGAFCCLAGGVTPLPSACRTERRKFAAQFGRTVWGISQRQSPCADPPVHWTNVPTADAISACREFLPSVPPISANHLAVC